MSENKTHPETGAAEANSGRAPEAARGRRPLADSKPPREWRSARPASRSPQEERSPTPPSPDATALESLHGEAARVSTTATSSHLEAPVPARHATPQQATQLPASYGVDRLVLLVRDPYWSYCWWELTQARLEAARRTLGEKGCLVLRFYDISLIDWDGGNHHSSFDIEVQALAGNWYVEIGRPGSSFVAEIGLRGMAGRFVAMMRSNAVELPRDGMSSQVDEHWLVSEERYQRLFELSGGAEIGLGSAEILRALEERLRRELAEAGVSSFGISSLASRRQP